MGLRWSNGTTWDGNDRCCSLISVAHMGLRWHLLLSYQIIHGCSTSTRSTLACIFCNSDMWNPEINSSGTYYFDISINRVVDISIKYQLIHGCFCINFTSIFFNITFILSKKEVIIVKIFPNIILRFKFLY